MITVGPLAAIADRIGGLGQHHLELGLDVLQDLVHLHDAGAEAGADLVGDLLRGLDAHVGLDERFEELVDELVVDQLPLALEEVADVGVEELSGLLQTLLEFFE